MKTKALISCAVTDLPINMPPSLYTCIALSEVSYAWAHFRQFRRLICICFGSDPIGYFGSEALVIQASYQPCEEIQARQEQVCHIKDDGEILKLSLALNTFFFVRFSVLFLTLCKPSGDTVGN